MRHTVHSLVIVLLSGWLAVVSAGEPELVVQMATHLAGIDLDGRDSSAPDNDDEADVELAGVPVQRTCRRTVLPELPPAPPLSYRNSSTPVRPATALSATFAPASHLGAGIFLRC
jgi:hypothetical protein